MSATEEPSILEPAVLEEEQPAFSVVRDPRTFVPLMRLALPVFCGQILDMCVGLTDTWLAGRYLPGDEYQAAMMVVNYSLWFLISIFSLIGIGTTALVSRAVGANQPELARRWMNLSLTLGAILCLLPAMMLSFFGPVLAALFGLNPTATGYVVTYWNWTALALPAMMLEQIGGAALRASGDTLSAMFALVATTLVDLFFSYVLVLGIEPFPQLGWSGLALGSVIGYYVGAVIMLAALNFGRAKLTLSRPRLAGQSLEIRRLLAIGIPGGVDMLAMIACHMGFVRVINELGTQAAAAHGIAIRLESLSYLPAIAFQVAATTIVGQFLGAQQPSRARHSVWIACLVGEVFVVLCGGVLFFWSDSLTPLMTKSSADVAPLAAQVLRIICLAQPALVVLMILTGALRGAGDTRWPLINTFIGLLLIRIPLAIVLALPSITLPFVGQIELLNLGLVGAWYAMVVDLCTRTALIVWRFRQGAWTRMKV
jgi:putative MATE family efflux protein